MDQLNLKSCTTDIVSLTYWGGSPVIKCFNPALEIRFWKSCGILVAFMNFEHGQTEGKTLSSQ
jgi:hypothetical protein